jgi:hypothetical protein
VVVGVAGMHSGADRRSLAPPGAVVGPPGGGLCPPSARAPRRPRPGPAAKKKRLRCGPRFCFRRRGPLDSLEPGARPRRGGGGGFARALAVYKPPVGDSRQQQEREQLLTLVAPSAPPGGGTSAGPLFRSGSGAPTASRMRRRHCHGE